MHNRDDVFKPFYLVKTAHVEYTFKLPESSDPPKVAIGKAAKSKSNEGRYFWNFMVKSGKMVKSLEVFFKATSAL